MSLGITEGTRNGSLFMISNNGLVNNGMEASGNSYGAPVGSGTNKNSEFTLGRTIGVVRNSTKSGIIADTSNMQSVNYIIKY